MNLHKWNGRTLFEKMSKEGWRKIKLPKTLGEIFKKTKDIDYNDSSANKYLGAE